jgi:hypothetical protein
MIEAITMTRRQFDVFLWGASGLNLYSPDRGGHGHFKWEAYTGGFGPLLQCSRGDGSSGLNRHSSVTFN